MIINQDQTRPSSQVRRKHNIVDKDYFRAMKTNKKIEQHFSKNKPAKDLSLNRFKNKS